MLASLITPEPVKPHFEDWTSDRFKAETTARSHGIVSWRKDLISSFFRAHPPEGGGYNAAELQAEINLLFIAGTDTTAVTLCGFFFYLTHNPRVYSKLITEIRSTYTTADEITSDAKLKSCTYLRACLDETLRMNPAAPSELSSPAQFSPAVQPYATKFSRKASTSVQRGGRKASVNPTMGLPTSTDLNAGSLPTLQTI